MKKISILLIICMMFSILPVTVYAQNDVYVQNLRVGLSFGADAKQVSNFYSDSPIEIIDAENYTYITTIPASTPLVFTADGNNAVCEYLSATATTLRLDSAGLIAYEGNYYRGSFEIKANGGAIRVINIINTEDYLASLLGKEMSVTWPIEALKAQAVCARNYAIENLGRHSAYGFDLCATQDCQVYGGIASEGESTLRAVKETEGVLVKYKGKVVPLFYFSCDGGYTESSENVWVAQEGYLRGKKDIYEKPEHAKYYNWSVTYTKEEIEDILVKKEYMIGELKDIRIDKMSENNGVIELTFVGTEGEKTVTKTATRNVLSLRSQAYTIEKHEKGKEEPVAEQVVQNVLTAGGVVDVTNPQYVLTSNGLVSLGYEAVEEEEDDDREYEAYTFNGHGWGHLVGMSQYGAYSMAKAGFGYKDILSFYFTDIEIAENSFSVFEDENEDKTSGMSFEEATDEAQAPTDADEETEAEEATENEESDTNYDETQWSDTGI